MSDPVPATGPVSTLQAITQVRELLDALGDALVSWRLGAVEAIHGDLTVAVSALVSASPPSLDPDVRRQLVAELGGAARAVGRCRRLGRSIGELTQIHAHARGQTESYTAAGTKTATGAVSLLRARA